MIAKRGVVYLVGAGPGDPELMTIKGARLLAEADVVIHDRLIPTESLQWCREEALQIDVGKYPDHHRVSQDEINELLVQHAAQGKTVVRLKGGDPFVFGRGLEELAVCRRHGVACFIVPGVSSSIAAPSAAGIPVTSRGVARSFAVVTGQTDPTLGTYSFEFEALARMDTIVLLMARKNLAEITDGLMAAGMDPETPAASIENATCDNQRVTSATVGTIAEVVKAIGINSPVVTVIGAVAAQVDSQLVELPEVVAATVTS
jgi:uroporphyrin-III C-methyltransferase